MTRVAQPLRWVVATFMACAVAGLGRSPEAQSAPIDASLAAAAVSAFAAAADGAATDSADIPRTSDAVAPAAPSEGGTAAGPGSGPIARALRSIPPADPAPLLPHHAAESRGSLSLPYGEPQFERFRAAYLSLGGKAWIEAVTERSRPYAAYIRDRIRHYGLPEELFFLPFIESEYLPKAVSKSGASGLWQFMRNSVDGYGIRIDDWVDERRDFMKSTDAALRKLRSNYERFGDWLIAIAAYNCGAGAMERAIKSSGGARDYWALREIGALPPETRTYIPKFLAVVSVAMHPGRHGLALSWKPSVDWVALSLDRPVDLAMLAASAGIPPETMKAGNPELRYGVTPPGGKYALKVPAESEADVRRALSSKDRLLNVYTHQVRSGDTVSAIARHYEVPVAMIERLNPGLVADRIRIGQTLVIPAFKEKAPYAPTQAADETLSFGASYVVVKGDTLWSLSLRYGVQPELLAEENGMSLSSVLREGMTLKVPIVE